MEHTAQSCNLAATRVGRSDSSMQTPIFGRSLSSPNLHQYQTLLDQESHFRMGTSCHLRDTRVGSLTSTADWHPQDLPTSDPIHFHQGNLQGQGERTDDA